MKYTITIQRQESPNDKPYLQSFYYESKGNETIAAILDYLNTSDNLYDVEGNKAKLIGLSCSCFQGMCGACAMVINGVPRLACQTKLSDIKGNIITLKPLSKFEVIRDLKTDRNSLYQAPIIHGLWNKGELVIDPKQYPLQYDAARCMKCGICYEVCPNTGKLSKNLGATFAVDCYLCYSQEKDPSVLKDTLKTYNANFGQHCSKSLSCSDLCPAHIDIKKIITYLNRK